ncbi:MAG: GntR family transcriptional regulator [Treponema sp.]|jgi:DNA-binding LacI/PurR family transcriptional regulator|nr:GntR family transcriptional regulator [Treponema sp.]
MVSLPQYKQIYDYLLEEISSGRLVLGSKVPSEKELCTAFKVSRITSKRALELLTEQGYISRYPGKGSFVSGNSKKNMSVAAIGCIIPDFSDSFGTKLLYGIEETCSALGYHLILKRTRNQAAVEEQAINSLIALGAEGFLLLPIHGEFYNAEILKLMLNKHAVVFVDRKMRGLAAPTVSTDNQGAVGLGVEYLLMLGHRNIAFYSGPAKNTSTVEDRRQGFIAAFAQFGVSHNPDYICQNLTSIWTYPFYAPERTIEDISKVKSHLTAHPEISAAIAAEYNMALIVKAAAEALERRVPGDFSILSFDAPVSIAALSPITHLQQDEYAIGKYAVETLHRIILGEDPASIEDILIPAKLISGASVSPVE